MKKIIDTLKNIWSIDELRNRIIFTLTLLLVYRVGCQIVLPGINPYVLATVSTIISDPRKKKQKALLASPVNIQELKFVEVEK